MRIRLKNIGNIHSANIELSGITVIAGENDTGKSTVGKALYSVFFGLHNYDEKISRDRIHNLEVLLDYVYQSSPFQETPETNEIAHAIVSNHKVGEPVEFKDIEKIIASYDKGILDNQSKTRSVLKNSFERIQMIMNITEEEAINRVVNNQINEEFSGQCLNFQAKEDGRIEIEIKGEKIEIRIGSQSAVVTNPIKIKKEVIYIDDPFILDANTRIGRSNPAGVSGYANIEHRVHLLTKLLQRPSESVIDEIITESSFDRVYQQVTSVCEGDIIRGRRGAFEYKKKNSEYRIDVHNLSTGMKSFMIIKMLLINGSLEYNGTIIMDEPEIHLHPEWQLIFAELIVLLHKEFHMHILLNTHSPYFLRAIEVFAARHKIADKCKYYLSEKDESFARIKDVSESTDQIYEKLSNPLQKLEDLRWSDD